jgi:uroporphyrinogen decarboxylase
MKTPRENLMRTLRREGYDTVPIELALCPSQRETFKKETGCSEDWYYPKYFNLPFRSNQVKLAPTYTDGRALFKREVLPESAQFDSWGHAFSQGSEAAQHMHRHHQPLKGDDVTLAEIEAYPFPTIDAAAALSMADWVRYIHAEGLAAKAQHGQTIWETAWLIRGMEDLMMDMLGDDERASAVLDRVTAVSLARMEVAAKAGCDIIWLGDDIGMQSQAMMSTELWETWLKPRLKKIIDAGKKINPDLLIAYHSCGYVIPFLEGLIDAGIDILNPVQPESMSFKEVYNQTGDRLSFWGTIGTQTTMPFGKPADVRKAVFENLDICGSRGGLVVAPTHLVEPEVPWENVLELVHAAADYTKQK